MDNNEFLSVETMKRLIWVTLAFFVAFWIIGMYVKKTEDIKNNQKPKIELASNPTITAETESIYDYVRNKQAAKNPSLPEGVETSPVFGTSPPTTTSKPGGIGDDTIKTKALTE